MSAFWEPATAMSTFHASVCRSLAPRPLMASTTRMAGVLATISPMAWMSLTDAGGRLAVLHVHGLDRRVGGQRLLDVGRVGLGAPGVVERGDLGAPRGVELLPALAEVADGGDEDVVARVDDVGDGRLHGAGAAGGVHHDVVLGLVDVLHPRDDLLEDLGEARRAVVDDRLGQGGEHLRRHGRGAGSDEEALLHLVVLSGGSVRCRLGPAHLLHDGCKAAILRNTRGPPQTLNA